MRTVAVFYRRRAKPNLDKSGWGSGFKTAIMPGYALTVDSPCVLSTGIAAHMALVFFSRSIAYPSIITVHLGDRRLLK